MHRTPLIPWILDLWILVFAAASSSCIIVVPENRFERSRNRVEVDEPDDEPYEQEQEGEANETDEHRSAAGPGATRRESTLGSAQRELEPTSEGLAKGDGDYSGPRRRVVFTIEGSEKIDRADNLWGFGLYYIPSEDPFGMYLNTRFTLRSTGGPDFTDVFSFNAFGHEVVDEELEAFLINIGGVRPVNERLSLFAGLGYVSTAIEAELRDPAGVFGDGGRYYQRRNERDRLNVNLGALLHFDRLALSAQWDTALEVFSFGAGVSF